MPATAERAAFAKEEFRSAVWKNDNVRNLYGKVARDTKDQPVVSFFDDKDDAQALIEERGALLGVHARRFRPVIDDVITDADLGMALAVPAATLIDDDLVADMDVAIVGIEVDFDAERSTIQVWGTIGVMPTTEGSPSTASGVATASLVGAAILSGSMGAAGVAQMSGVGAKVAPGSLSAPGTSSATIAGDDASAGSPVTATGASAASLTGRSLAAGSLSASGTGAISFVSGEDLVAEGDQSGALAAEGDQSGNLEKEGS